MNADKVLNKEEMASAIAKALNESIEYSPEYVDRLKVYAQGKILKAANSGYRKIIIEQGDYKLAAFNELVRWIREDLQLEIFHTAGNTTVTVYF